MSRGEVTEPQHDARLARGAETARRIEAAFLKLAIAGCFWPTLDSVAAQAGLSRGALLRHFASSIALATLMVDKHAGAIVGALGLSAGKFNDRDARALAHALLVGKRLK